MQDNLAQQQNLDQEQHNDWLMRQSPKELKQLAHNLTELARLKLSNGKSSLKNTEQNQ